SLPSFTQISPEKRSQIEALASHFMTDNKIPGVSVAVVENGAYEWSRGFGMADLDNGVRASPQTLNRLASIAKAITATTAMKVEGGESVALAHSIQRYVPSFPTKEAQITTRQLLAHLAGIRHYKTDSLYDAEIRTTKHVDDPIQGGLDVFKNDPLVAAPGT